MKGLEIVPTEERHLQQVLEIASSYRLDTGSKMEKNGFLVSGFSMEDYHYFLKIADYFFVLEKGEEVLGFILAYSNNHIAPDEKLNMIIQSQNDEAFVLIKQVCIRKTFSGKGSGRLLYNYLFDRADKSIFYAAIVLEPYNSYSVNFH